MNKKICVISIIAAVLMSLVPLYVFADNEYSFIPISAPYNTVSLNGVTEESQYTYCYFTTNNDVDYYGNIYRDSTYSTNSNELYYCLIRSGQNSYNLMLAVEGDITSNDGTNVVRVSTSSNGSQGYNIQNGNRTYNALFNLSWNKSSSSITCLPYCNVYDTVDDALNALRTAIDNGTAGGGTVATPKYASITIEPGYIAFIGTSGGTAHLEITYPYKFSSATLSNQSYWFSDSLPDGNFNVNTIMNNPQPLIWNAAGPFDATRRTYNGEFDISSLGNNYLVIYNPVLSMGFEKSNDTIKAIVSSTISVIQYPLTSNGSYVNQDSSGNTDNVYVAANDAINDDGSIDYTHYDLDDNGNTVTSSAINLPAGGNNIIDDDNDSTISNFISQILNLLSAPIKHIRRLFDSGSEFMQWLGNLWTWLPEPVYTVLGSALVVLIVIGVIKFLWK